MTATLDWAEYAAREFEVARPPTWREIARPEQLAPEGDWLVWAYVAGRGAGKTRSAAEWVHEKATLNPGVRIALVGRTPADVRDVMIEGESGILACAGKQRPVYESTKRKLTWANGSTAHAYSAEVPDQLRGPQHGFAWCLPGETLVQTESGPQEIQAIRVGDRVWTRAGLRSVLRSGCTRRNADLVEVETSSGEVLRATSDHEVWVVDSGWKPLGCVVPGDTLIAWNDSSQDRRLGTNGTTLAGTATGGATTRTAPEPCCTSQSGNAPTGKVCPAGTSSTTPTTTRTTTRSTTSSALRQPNTPGTISKNGPTATPGDSHRPARAPAQARLRSGTSESRATSSATNAESSTNQPGCAPGSAPKPALRATVVVRAERSPSRADVYDITVAGEHEFFASNVLVHNCDEPAAWTDARKGDVLDTAWNNLMLGLRLGANPQCVATTTPKPNALIRTLLKRRSTVVSRGSTYDNLGNLAPSFREQVLATYEGTRIGRQELLGELLEDVEGALWTLERIDAGRVQVPPDMQRLVVAVDPSGGSGPNNDEQGIVVAGLGVDGGLYVLADRSCKLSPHGWASRAIAAYREFAADRVVAERNFGGEMVESTILQVDKTVPVKVITASRGKAQRAEPIAALYEHDPVRVHHVGAMPQLEDQLTTWTPQDGTSPDRLDAMVWALTELTDGLGADAWIEYMKRRAEEAGMQARERPTAATEPADPESEPDPEPDDPRARLRAARTAALRDQRFTTSSQ